MRKLIYDMYIKNKLDSNWNKLILTCTRTKNHLLVLNQLVSQKSLRELEGLDYKKASKILSEFSKEGLVISKRVGKTKYFFLTNKGQLVNIFLSGSVQSKKLVKSDFDKIYFDKDEVIVERLDLIKELLYHLNRKRNVLLLGESGLGKTTLLKHLSKKYLPNSVYVESTPTKQLLEDVCEKLSIELKNIKGRKKRIIELVDEIVEQENKELIILVDEFQDATSQVIKILKKLDRAGYVLLCAGLVDKGKIPFHRTLTIKPLTYFEVQDFVSQLLNQELEKYPDDLFNLIVNNSGNSPEGVKKYVDEILILKENKELDISNKKSKHWVTTQIKKFNYSRINLISKNSLVNLGFLFLGIRYLAYGKREYQTGYMFAIAAYTIFFLFRKRKK